MAKHKSDRFKLLQRLANKREQAAVRALGKSQQNLQTQQGRLSELNGFRHDYQQQFKHNGRQGMSGAALQLYHRFMQQLDQAIAQQQGTVSAADHECQHKKHDWQQTHIKTRIYDKTVERALNHEQQHAQRQEQKETDDRPKRK
ncbi:MAG: flagellar export protein FliJ [Gammaproteobacteria bacterium]|nr:flagellar export protein FliJ [Gammaproteobacteria bacterium]